MAIGRDWPLLAARRLGGWRVPARGTRISLRNQPLLLVLAEAVVEFAQADAQLGGGGGAVAVVFFQDREDVTLFHLLQRRHRRRVGRLFFDRGLLRLGWGREGGRVNAG